jgi:hypothetical protein
VTSLGGLMCQLFTIIGRTVGVVCLAVMAVSCGDPPTASLAGPTPNRSAVTPSETGSSSAPGTRPPPVAPGTPPPSTPPGPPPARSPVLSVAGLVTDESGNPIGGATVTGHGRGTQLRVLTDGHGRYGFDVPQPNYLGLAVTVEKVGFELNEQVAQRPMGAGPGPAAIDFRLYPVDRFVAGASRRVTITSNDSLCAVLDVGGTDYHWFCRTHRVQAPETGTLVVEVVPDGPAGSGELWTRPGPYYRCCAPRQTFAIPAGAEVEVIVMTAIGRVPQTVTLNTSLLP